MKQEIIIRDTQYVDTDHEQKLKEIKDGLKARCALQGQHDGTDNTPNAPGEHQALILNMIEVTVQDAIDVNQQRYLPISGAAVARLAEIDADKEIAQRQMVINDTEHALPAAIKAAEDAKPDIKKIKARKFVLFALGIVAAMEGILSYNPFRHAGLAALTAFSAGVSVAIGVFFGAHFSGGVIKNAKNHLVWVVRYVLLLMPAVVIFSFLAMLRVRSYQHVFSLHPDGHQDIAATHTTIPVVAIALVSIGMYALALLMSAIYFRTDKERLQEQDFEEKSKAVADLQKSIQDKYSEIEAIKKDTETKITLAYKRFEYARNQEDQLVNFAQVAAEEYKQKNMRYRSNGCPAFFSSKPVFHFIRFFDIAKSQTQQYEAVN